jgi:hypothetical protein
METLLQAVLIHCFGNCPNSEIPFTSGFMCAKLKHPPNHSALGSCMTKVCGLHDLLDDI